MGQVFKYIAWMVIWVWQGVSAQALQLTATLDHTEISLSDTLTLSISLESETKLPGGEPQFEAEAFEQQGVQSFFSSQSQYDSYRGKFSQLQTKTFRYVLSPRKTGLWKVRKIRFQVGTQWLTAPDLSVSVVQDLALLPSSQAAQGGTAGTVLKRKRGADPFWIEVEVLRLGQPLASSSPLYKGEQVEVRYILVSQGGQLSHLELGEPPEFKGFLKEEWDSSVSSKKTIDWQPASCQGQPCRKAVLVRYGLSPIQVGSFQWDPLRVQLAYSASRSMDDPTDLASFGGFFAPFFQDLIRQDKQLKSPSLSVEVKEVPLEGQPAGFSGAVGQFEFTANLSASQTRVNEAVTWTIEIKGKGGDLHSWQLPAFSLPPGIEMYDSKGKGGTQGQSRTFELVLLPRVPGSFQLPSLSFSFFHPLRKQYQTIQTPSFSLEVTGSAPRFSPSPPVANLSAEVPPDSAYSTFKPLKPLKPLPSIAQATWDFPPLWRVLYWLVTAGAVVFIGLVVKVLWSQSFFGKASALSSAGEVLFQELEGGLKTLSSSQVVSSEKWKQLGLWHEKLLGGWIAVFEEKTQVKAQGLSRREQKALWVTDSGMISEPFWQAVEKIWEVGDRIRFAKGAGMSFEEACRESQWAVQESRHLLREFLSPRVE